MRFTGGSGVEEGLDRLSMSSEEDRTWLEKFDGSDPSAYSKWRRKAEGPMLLASACPVSFEKT